MLYALPGLVLTHLQGADLGVPVLGAADLEGVAAARQQAPAVHVISAGIEVVEVSASGRQVQVRERVLVSVAVRNLATLRSGEAAREEAAPLAAQLLGMLAGWQPPTPPGGRGCRPLAAETPPPPAYADGYGYYPLQFATQYVMGG